MKKIVLLLLLLVACGTPETMTVPYEKQQLKPISGEPPSGLMTAPGGQVLAYQLYMAEPNSPGVVLLHMLGRDRTDWNAFAKSLQRNGYSVITYDLRGHGQSAGNWEDFSAREFNQMTGDIGLAKSMLQNNGANVKDLTVIGASIGANLALNYAVGDADVQKLVLLSPGLTYRGVSTNDVVHLFDRALIAIASEEDEYSSSSVRKLAGLNNRMETVYYNNAGHGTTMFVNAPLEQRLITWLKSR